jgi:hypothetical protein
VRARTSGGSRLAIAAERPTGVLPPNLETRLGLHSVHGYDPLSSGGYRAWCAVVSIAGTQVLGRWFQHVAGTEGFAGAEFAAANVGLVLSRSPVRSAALSHEGFESGWHFHRPLRDPLREAHVLDVTAADLGAGTVPLTACVQDRLRSEVLVVERRDDAWRARLTPQAERTLLFVSMQHHPHWIARDASGAQLATVVVGSTFLGVDVPPGCGEVALAFEPWSRHAWIPQAAFAVLAVVIAGQAVQRRRRNRTMLSAALGSG